MSASRVRQIGWWLLLAIFTVAAVTLHRRYSPVVPRMNHLTGWALFLVMLALTFYNARKKLPFLPLAKSETWLQFHLYAGVFTGVLFLLHVNGKIPRGWFEGTLTWLYGLVMVSGVAGLVFSRDLPKRLTTFGGEVLFERIPVIRAALRDQADELALASVPKGGSSIIADFYLQHLRDFFDGPRNAWLHLFEVRRPLNTLLNKITDLNRYLNEEERHTMNRLATLVRQKDGLDFHHALQRVLKGWLFVHIPLTYSLLLFTLAHLVLVFAFSGGAK